MFESWCDLELEEWSGLTIDAWADLSVCIQSLEDIAPQPSRIAKGTPSYSRFIDYPVVDAVPAGVHTPGGLHSVILQSGAFSFQQLLMAIPSLGGFVWRFGVNYNTPQPNRLPAESVMGPGWDYPQNLRIVQNPKYPPEFRVYTPEKMVPEIEVDGETTAAGRLVRVGAGSTEEYILYTSNGSASYYYGLDPATAAPGRMKRIADRYGNEMSYQWETHDVVGREPIHRLTQVTDGYGRVIDYRYVSTDSSDPQIVKDGYRLTEVEDFEGRKLNFQYNADGNLAAIVLPSINQAVSGNTYPQGSAYVFGYDAEERLNRVFFPDQCQSHMSVTERSVDVPAVLTNAEARYFVTYDGKDRVDTECVGNDSGTVGGTIGYHYDPDASNEDRIAKTTVTDRNGNVSVFEFNENGMPVKQVVERNRDKFSVSSNPQPPTEYEVVTEYNANNQPKKITFPEGNFVEMFYEEGDIPGLPNYRAREGLLTRQVVHPDSQRGGSGSIGEEQQQLVTRFFYDPIYNSPVATIDPRGGPIKFDGAYFTPQNGGTATPDRYATWVDLDYQQSTLDELKSDTTIQTITGLSNPADIVALVGHANDQLAIAGLPPLAMNQGDINGDDEISRKLGTPLRVRHPDVTLVGGETQPRHEVLTCNLRGQVTTMTSPEGNVSAILRHPANKPDGVNTVAGNIDTHQYGFVKAVHSDVEPDTVAGLVGNGATGGDLTSFTLMIARDAGVQPDLNGDYQSLVTQYPTYDSYGNALSMSDARGHQATIDRTELGEPYRVNGPAPLNYKQETLFNPNRTVERQEVKDIVVQVDASDQFTPSGSGTTANVASQDGPGGATRSGWFTHRFEYDLLDNLTASHVDATGSTPDVLTTRYEYDRNQNLIKVIKPEENTVEMDYDERNLLVAQREQSKPGDPNPTEPSIGFVVHDKNSNTIGSVGPANRDGATEAVTLTGAFGSGSSINFTGDYSSVKYDGFDRPLKALDPEGNRSEADYDPLGQAVEARLIEGVQDFDSPGIRLFQQITRYDEAARAYEQQEAVFLAAGAGPASGRAVMQTGGGLAANSLADDHTGDTTLTPGIAESYVLSRAVYDRAGRVYQTLADNTGVFTTQYDGASRVIRESDPLGNRADYEYDANSNVVRTTATELHPDPPGLEESFVAAMRYDVLDRPTVSVMQGADGSEPPTAGVPSANAGLNAPAVSYAGYDSRDNATHSVDSRHNTAVSVVDGASRMTQMLQHLRTGGDGAGSVASTLTTQTTYDANSRPTQLMDAKNQVTTYEYDGLDRPKSLVFHTGIGRTFGYNTASDLTNYTDENGTQFTYGFDALGRQKTTTINQLAAGVVGTTGLVQTFEYDGLSRLTRATDTSASSQPAPADGVVTEFLHDGDQVCEERDASSGTPAGGETMRQYIWGNYVDELLQQREYLAPDGDTHTDLYPLSDLHYRTIALTDNQRRIVEAYDTDAYGNTLIYQGCGPDGQWFTDDDVPLDLAAGDQLLCKHLYTGRYLDEETGLYYYRARYYSPEQGRFIQRDPAGYQAGMNLYEYAGGMPTGAVDPDGELFVTISIGIIVLLTAANLTAHIGAEEMEAGFEKTQSRDRATQEEGYKQFAVGSIWAGTAPQLAAGAATLPFAAVSGGSIPAFLGISALAGGSYLGISNGLTSYTFGGSASDIAYASAESAAYGAITGVLTGGLLLGVGVALPQSIRIAFLANRTNRTFMHQFGRERSAYAIHAARGRGEQVLKLYRGVNDELDGGAVQHLRRIQAGQGMAVPNRQAWHFWRSVKGQRPSSAREHNTGRGGTINSPYTSWTPDKAVALRNASLPSSTGTLLTARVPASRVRWSPDLHRTFVPGRGFVSEQEKLLKGVVYASPFKIGF